MQECIEISKDLTAVTDEVSNFLYEYSYVNNWRDNIFEP